jgi:hypothetical protein
MAMLFGCEVGLWRDLKSKLIACSNVYFHQKWTEMGGLGGHVEACGTMYGFYYII